jgi:hypothetical protein
VNPSSRLKNILPPNDNHPQKNGLDWASTPILQKGFGTVHNGNAPIIMWKRDKTHRLESRSKRWPQNANFGIYIKALCPLKGSSRGNLKSSSDPVKKRLSDVRSPQQAWALGGLLVNVSARQSTVMEPGLFKGAQERRRLVAPGTKSLGCSNFIAFPLFGWIVFSHMDTLLYNRRILIIHLSPDRGKEINLMGGRFIKSLGILETYSPFPEFGMPLALFKGKW